MEALQKLSQNRYLRFALAGLCFMLFSQGVMRLVYQQSKYDLIRGVGEVLLWGGWAIVNIAHPFWQENTKSQFRYQHRPGFCHLELDYSSDAALEKKLSCTLPLTDDRSKPGKADTFTSPSQRSRKPGCHTNKQTRAAVKIISARKHKICGKSRRNGTLVRNNGKHMKQTIQRIVYRTHVV